MTTVRIQLENYARVQQIAEVEHRTVQDVVNDLLAVGIVSWHPEGSLGFVPEAHYTLIWRDLVNTAQMYAAPLVFVEKRGRSLVFCNDTGYFQPILPSQIVDALLFDPNSDKPGHEHWQLWTNAGFAACYAGGYHRWNKP